MLSLTKLLQWLLDDERLKPREERERHPISQDMPTGDLSIYCFELQCLTAQLWDQVWYLSQPWYKRLGFRLLGFKAPIQKFYLPPKDH